jgi:hypothetical protein
VVTALRPNYLLHVELAEFDVTKTRAPKVNVPHLVCRKGYAVMIGAIRLTIKQHLIQVTLERAILEHAALEVHSRKPRPGETTVGEVGRSVHGLAEVSPGKIHAPKAVSPPVFDPAQGGSPQIGSSEAGTSHGRPPDSPVLTVGPVEYAVFDDGTEKTQRTEVAAGEIEKGPLCSSDLDEVAQPLDAGDGHSDFWAH